MQSEDSDSTKENSPPPQPQLSLQHAPQAPPPVAQQIQHAQAVTVRRTSSECCLGVCMGVCVCLMFCCNVLAFLPARELGRVVKVP